MGWRNHIVTMRTLVVLFLVSVTGCGGHVSYGDQEETSDQPIAPMGGAPSQDPESDDDDCERLPEIESQFGPCGAIVIHVDSSYPDGVEGRYCEVSDGKLRLCLTDAAQWCGDAPVVACY